MYVCVSLGHEETQALVRAMESRVVNVRIRDVHHMNMTLDITELTKYSGQGRCSHLQCYLKEYREELSAWALSKNWHTELINNGPLYFNREMRQSFE